MRKMVPCKARHRQPVALSDWRRASRVAVSHWPPHMSVRSAGSDVSASATRTQPLPARWRQKQISMMWTVKAVGLGVVGLSLSWELFAWFRRRPKPRRTLHEVLFFPSETACLQHIFFPSSTNSCLCPLPHGVETSFSRLLCHILSAKSSVDVCVFCFSNMALCSALLALQSKGVTIQVLTDNDYTAIPGSQIGVLRKAGICVRCDATPAYMHHKFVVVDGRLLITGSLNWTLSAVQSNMENALITEEPELVQPFIAEFSRLWAFNDPALHHPSVDRKPACVVSRTCD